MSRSLAVVLALASVAAAPPSPTERYFDGLRQRGLFDVAEGVALRRLAARPPADEQPVLVAELARTLAEHSKYQDDAARAELAARADAALAEYLEADPDSAARPRLEVLRGELALDAAEATRWLAELQPERTDLRASAESALTIAIEFLSDAEAALARRHGDRVKGRTTERTEPIGVPELAELLMRTRLALGRAALERAKLAESKATALAAVAGWLDPLAKGPERHPVTWRSKVFLAEADRLAGRLDAARRRLAAIDSSLLPDESKDAVAAATARILLDERKPDRAVEFLIEYRRTRGSLTGELRLLQVLGLAQAADALENLGKETEADSLRAQIPVVIGWAEAEQGGYWAYRVRLAARSAERSGRYGPDVAELARKAEAAAAAKDIDAASAAYLEAERLAASAPDVAADFAYSRAALLLAAERFAPAAEAFAAIADRYPDSSNSGEAHLLSAYALGRVNDLQPSVENEEAYAARLQDHRIRYAGAATAAEATVRLARLHERRRQYIQAIPLLKGLSADPERGPSARAAIARNYENLLLHLYSASPAAPAEAVTREHQRQEWTAAAIRDLRVLAAPLAAAERRSLPVSAHEAELALRSARIFMSQGDDASLTGDLLDLLAVAVTQEHPENEQDFWNAARRSVIPLRVLSLADRGRHAEAVAELESLKDAPIADLTAVVRRLGGDGGEEPAGASPAAFGPAGDAGPGRRDLARAAVEMLSRRRAELPPEEARRLDLALAEASLEEGRVPEAMRLYDAALAARPNDKQFLIDVASALLDSGDPRAVRRSRDHWRRVEKLEKSGGDAWLRARAKAVEASLALGDFAEARKVLTATKLLHPQLGGGETRSVYESLQRRLDAAPALKSGSAR